MQKKIIERYFFFGLLLAVFIFAFFIFKPFWIVLVLGASLSVVLYPIHKWLMRRKLPDWLASILTVIFFIIIFCGPLLGIGILVFNQSQNVYHSVISGAADGPLVVSLQNKITAILPQGVNFDLNQKISELTSYLFGNIVNIFNTTLTTLMSFILLLFSIFYFLKDGERWKKAIIKISPISDADDQKIIARLTHSINGIFKGTMLVALAQGFLMTIGLAFFGVPNPVLWGAIAAVASMIPSVGTAVVSVPAIIYLYMTGHLLPAIGLLAWAGLLVGTIDNLLNPFLVGRKIDIPPFLILFSVLGGISLLGPAGILIGPLVVSLLYALVSIYRNEFTEKEI